jgi:hypothetical protein
MDFGIGKYIIRDKIYLTFGLSIYLCMVLIITYGSKYLAYRIRFLSDGEKNSSIVSK